MKMVRDVVSRAVSPTARGTTNVAGAFPASETNLADISDTLDKLGSNAVLADVNPAAQARAKAIAAYDPAAGNVMKENLDARLEKNKADLEAQSRALYDPIVRQSPDGDRVIDLSPAASVIDQFRAPALAAGTEEGPAGTALRQARAYLPKDPSNVPIGLAHTAQIEIRNLRDSAPGGAALKPVHHALMDSMPPDYQEATAQYRQWMEAQEAMQKTNDMVEKGLQTGFGKEARAEGVAKAGPVIGMRELLTGGVGGEAGARGGEALAGFLGLPPEAGSIAGRVLGTATPLLLRQTEKGAAAANRRAAELLTSPGRNMIASVLSKAPGAEPSPLLTQGATAILRAIRQPPPDSQ
jgi:hypothetical protein